MFERVQRMNEFQRSTMRPENAARIREIINQIDAKDLIAARRCVAFTLMLECTSEPTKFLKK
mgnify:CR=1 FL=1